MKYVSTVEAQTWDSSNEAQVDKIVDWLTINAPNMFEVLDGELRVQTSTGIRTVNDGDVIIYNAMSNWPEVMTSRAFQTIYSMLNEEF